MARSRNTADTQTASGGPVSPSVVGKNKVINGAMEIDQRNNGSSTSAIGYNVDRWNYYSNLSSKLSFQRVTDAPTGFSNSLKVTSSAATTPASGDRFILSHSVEGYNVTDLVWGTASAKTITVSFWVKSSLTGTFVVSFNDVSGSVSYVSTYTISAANTWEYKTLNITGPTNGTWNAGTTSTGLLINFNFGTGSSLQTSTLNSWQSAFYESTSTATKLVSTNAATWQLTGVQIEVGVTVTPFSRAGGTIQGELAACMRYCQMFNASEANGAFLRYGVGQNIDTTQTFTQIPLSPPMRVVPSLTTTGTAADYGVYSRNTVTACNSAPVLGGNSVSPKTLSVYATVASGLTIGNAMQLTSNNNTTSYLLLTAEL